MRENGFITNFFSVVSVDEILFAFIAAYILTMLIRRLFSGFKLVGISGDIQINYNPKNFKNVLKSCYDLFPKDNITFRGNTFKRGMNVEILTSGNRVIKGQIVGLNNENMICLITAKYIIAQELSQILAIKSLECEKSSGGD